MDGLRPRKRLVYSGFSKAEVEKMERILVESEKPLNEDSYKKIARSFSMSASRAGKPIVKWTEVQSWFQDKKKDSLPPVASSINSSKADGMTVDNNPSSTEKESTKIDKEENDVDLSALEFEARSSKDGAWYDVDMFVSHRFLESGEAEVRVRYVGFGADEDEWVSVKNAVRERSIPLENTECQKVKVGDLVCCYQEKRDQARYYDAHVADIQRRMHDIRGCRCLFLIRYNHDNTEERVRLKRLCRRPIH